MANNLGDWVEGRLGTEWRAGDLYGNGRPEEQVVLRGKSSDGQTKILIGCRSFVVSNESRAEFIPKYPKGGKLIPLDCARFLAKSWLGEGWIENYAVPDEVFGISRYDSNELEAEDRLRKRLTAQGEKSTEEGRELREEETDPLAEDTERTKEGKEPLDKGKELKEEGYLLAEEGAEPKEQETQLTGDGRESTEEEVEPTEEENESERWVLVKPDGETTTGTTTTTGTALTIDSTEIVHSETPTVEDSSLDGANP